jgi:hypothetical protein
LSTRRLKGYVGIVVAEVAIAALVALAALAILAVLPGMAQAQEEAEAQEDTGTATVEASQNTTTTDEKGAPAGASWQRSAPEEPSRGTTPLVVEPGESLWSISEEHIGAGATPEQVAYEVQRIFELNRERIGEDPNLIFPGQEFFLVSPASGNAAAAAVPEEPVASEEPVAVAEQQRALEPIVAESEGVSDSPAAEDAVLFEDVVAAEDVAAEGAVSEGAVSEGAVPAPQTPVHSTDEQVQSTPAESVSSTESTPATTSGGGIAGFLLEAYNNLKAEPRLLGGVGIIALTLIIAALMAWRLPLRRNVEDYAAWGIPQEYSQEYDENYAPPEVPPEASSDPSLESSPEASPESAQGGPEGEPSSAASGAPLEEATPEPSATSSATSSSSLARGVQGGDAAAAVPSDAAAVPSDAAAAGASTRTQERLDQERLNRVRHLRRIRQRPSSRTWWGGQR